MPEMENTGRQLREYDGNTGTSNPFQKDEREKDWKWIRRPRILYSCISNNAAEREIRPIAVGRHNWTFAGSDEGARRAAAIYTLINTARLNRVDPQAWLADTLRRIADHPAKRVAELMPWNWKPVSQAAAA